MLQYDALSHDYHRALLAFSHAAHRLQDAQKQDDNRRGKRGHD